MLCRPAGARTGKEPLAVLVDDPSLAVPELREAHVVLLADARGRCGHRPSVELVEIARELSPALAREVETVALAPRVAANDEPVLARVANGEAARREHQ